MIQREASEWVERLREADIPCSIVQDYASIRHDPQAITNGYIQEVDHPVWGSIATHGPSALFSETPGAITRHAPILPGDHSAEILTEGGFSSEEVAALAEAGVVTGEQATDLADASG